MTHPISPEEERALFDEMKDEDDDLGIDENARMENAKEVYVDRINVADIGFTLDAKPLVPGCDCYTCREHSRAYIHHLWNVHEMNAEILLQMLSITLQRINRL